jgi:hypothetical protein
MQKVSMAHGFSNLVIHPSTLTAFVNILQLDYLFCIENVSTPKIFSGKTVFLIQFHVA